MRMLAHALVRVLCGIAFAAIPATVILSAAGRIDPPWVWAFFALHAMFGAAFVFVMPRDLVKERLRPPAEGRVHDHRVLTGLDLGRLHWGDTVPARPAMGRARLLRDRHGSHRGGHGEQPVLFFRRAPPAWAGERGSRLRRPLRWRILAS